MGRSVQWQIYVAPTRTLEDLEHSTAEQLALDDANPLELDSFKWNDSDIRRQPRTSLYRAAKKYISYIDPKESNRENSQNMKMECQPLLQKEKQNECPPLLQKEKQKECPPFEVKLDQPHGMRKNKRSSLGDFTGASQSSHSHTLIKVKVCYLISSLYNFMSTNCRIEIRLFASMYHHCWFYIPFNPNLSVLVTIMQMF